MNKAQNKEKTPLPRMKTFNVSKVFLELNLKQQKLDF